MDLKTMRTQTPDALTREWKDAENKLHALRMKCASNQLKRVREIRVIRAEIARLKTFIHGKNRPII